MENIAHLKNTLIELWLEEKEITIYFTTLKLGNCVSSTVAHMTRIPKSSVRYAMESLVKKWMMTKTQKWNTTIFTPEHPNTLKNLLIIEKNKIEDKQHRLDNIMWELIGLYNPHTKIPKVTFYEGLDWIQQVLDDSLTSSEVIDGFVNVDDVIDNISEINKKYTENRIKNWIEKKSIYSDSKKTKEYLETIYKNNWLNNIKYLDTSEYNLYISFMIYDGKISYITFKDNSFVGVIIQNTDIYNFHKNIFKFMWNHL